MRRALALLPLLRALFLLAIAVVQAAEPEFPPLTGRVNDRAGLLSERDQERAGGRARAVRDGDDESDRGRDLESLQGLPIEEYGYQLGRHWGIGQAGKDNGALLIVAPEEREVRIEVGYGLEGELTDAQSRTIIETSILPHFRQGDFAAGIKAGVAAMIDDAGRQLRPCPAPGSGPGERARAVTVPARRRAADHHDHRPQPPVRPTPAGPVSRLSRAGHRARRLGRPAWRLRRWRAGRRVQRWRRQLRRRWRIGTLVTMAFLTDQDRQKIADAITATERTTSGELVAVVAQAADDYRYVPLLWPALAALLLPAILLDHRPGHECLDALSCRRQPRSLCLLCSRTCRRCAWPWCPTR